MKKTQNTLDYKPSSAYNAGMSKRKSKLGDQIRAAVDASGVSRYAICKATGIDQASFSRFMKGHIGLTLANLDALADTLNLRVVSDGPATVPPAGRPGRKPKTGKAR